MKFHTQEYLEGLRQSLNYNRETGSFTWALPSSRGVKKGDLCGCVNPTNGYRVIRFRNNLLAAHRMVWFFETGIWPNQHIDHINGDRLDNRFFNLRQATIQQNNYNVPKKKH